MSADLVLFEDFFVDDNDPGVEKDVVLTARDGSKHTIQVRIRRALSLGDREAAKSAATKTHVAPDGSLVVDGFDNGIFMVEVLTRCVIRWPFERAVRDESGAVLSHSPVAVTRDNVRKLKHENGDAFAELVNGIVQGAAADKANMDRFEKPSEEA